MAGLIMVAVSDMALSLVAVEERGVGYRVSRPFPEGELSGEMIITDHGVNLTEVFVSQGDVVMGGLRWERQRAEEAAQVRAQAEIEKVRQEVEQAQAELPTLKKHLFWGLMARRNCLCFCWIAIVAC